VRRWRRAKDTLALAEQSFNQAMSASAGVAVSEADVEQWIEEEKICILSTPPPVSSNNIA